MLKSDLPVDNKIIRTSAGEYSGFLHRMKKMSPEDKNEG